MLASNGCHWSYSTSVRRVTYHWSGTTSGTQIKLETGKLLRT